MGVTGIDRSELVNNHAMEDAIHLNKYQKINANNKTISAESRIFADNVIALFSPKEELAMVA